ncbi:MAG: DUF1836 domain-containing protein [Lachnospiraceae bacterium]|nr:DUF1836 domain-containing protein [Lachnospiraceae bacterium]MBQ6994311.1 DUF1836 domain-containing protein [Lachnospiraceae bacterium]
MHIDTKDLLNSILASLDRIDYIKAMDIPNIDLYMDQVTTFMDNRLRKGVRYPEQDKVMTKTMINNYAKNDLLPPPNKKKYSKEHILVLIFIYYYKGFLSIGDIQTLLQPITEKYFQTEKDFNIEDIYEEVFQFQEEQIEVLKKDVMDKYEKAAETFSNVQEEEQEFLKKFSFICLLGFDVYVKKMLIEKLIDDLKNTGEDKKKG